MIGAPVSGVTAPGTWAPILGWTFDPLVVAGLGIAVGAYAVGVRRIARRRGAARWPISRCAFFGVGITVLFVALASPIDLYSDLRLSVHMVQHVLLAIVAPPFLLLGRPVTLAYASSSLRTRRAISTLARSRPARIVGSPAVGFGAFAVFLWASHFTSLYEASLQYDQVHVMEHAAYLVTGLLFWWPVVSRDPGAVRLTDPARLMYLFLAMPVMSLLGFVVSSSGQVLYHSYAVASGSVRAALADQRLAGTLMWVGSMLISVSALSVVLLDWMDHEERDAKRADRRRMVGQRDLAGAGLPIQTQRG